MTPAKKFEPATAKHDRPHPAAAGHFPLKPLNASIYPSQGPEQRVRLVVPTPGECPDLVAAGLPHRRAAAAAHLPICN